MIPCEVTGFPEPTITWEFNGDTGINLMDELSTEQIKYKKLGDGLFIQNINREDAGAYTCKAFQITDALTNSKEQVVKLLVHCKLRKKFSWKIFIGIFLVFRQASRLWRSS